MRATMWVGLAVVIGAAILPAQGYDWPQWRGPNRDAKAINFNAPAAWPKELSKQWTQTVGDGVASPSLVGDKLYVYSRQGATEVMRCLNAADGKEVWKATYESRGADGPAGSFAGPRATPAVADGKVFALSVRGTLSCYNADNGSLLWRNEDYKGSAPMFFTSCSPVVAEGMCIVQQGGENKGAIVAYDLANGKKKWAWDGDGTAYASPIVHEVGGIKEVVAETSKSVVGVSLMDGKLLWQIPFAVPRERGRGYNSSCPIVDGDLVVIGGSNRGTRAYKLEKDGNGLKPVEVWKNDDNSVMYNTPVIAQGLLFGLSNDDKLYCINMKTGKTAWTESLRPPGTPTAQNPPAKGQQGKGPPGKGGMRGGGMRGGGGYGSIVLAGNALVALTPRGSLVVFEATDAGFQQLATYKVASGDTYAYPVLDGERVFIKDKDAVTLWTVK